MYRYPIHKPEDAAEAFVISDSSVGEPIHDSLIQNYRQLASYEVRRVHSFITRASGAMDQRPFITTSLSPGGSTNSRTVLSLQQSLSMQNPVADYASATDYAEALSLWRYHFEAAKGTLCACVLAAAENRDGIVNALNHITMVHSRKLKYFGYTNSRGETVPGIRNVADVYSILPSMPNEYKLANGSRCDLIYADVAPPGAAIAQFVTTALGMVENNGCIIMRVGAVNDNRFFYSAAALAMHGNLELLPAITNLEMFLILHRDGSRVNSAVLEALKKIDARTVPSIRGLESLGMFSKTLHDAITATFDMKLKRLRRSTGHIVNSERMHIPSVVDEWKGKTLM